MVYYIANLTCITLGDVCFVILIIITLLSSRDFAWSPTDNIIAYWTPEGSDTPARVTLINLPKRDVLCVKVIDKLHQLL